MENTKARKGDQWSLRGRGSILNQVVREGLLESTFGKRPWRKSFPPKVNKCNYQT